MIFSLKSKTEIKTFVDKTKLREFIVRKSALHEIIKEGLQVKGNLYQIETLIFGRE